MRNNDLISGSIKYYFTTSEIFEDIDVKRLSVKRKALNHKFKNPANIKIICSRIFAYFLYLIILDIIRNNITFIFPTSRVFVLGIRVIEGKRLKEYMRNKKSEMYDYFGSGFRLPRINLFYQKRKNEIRTREVMLNYSLTKEFFDNINNGKAYG